MGNYPPKMGNYSYFDTPDGEDCDKKLIYMLKKATTVGLFCSVGYVILHEQKYKPTRLQVLARFARITVPCLAFAGVTTMSICMVTNMRQKDERSNYTIGGFIGGGLAGILIKGRIRHGVVGGFLTSFIGTVIKDAHMHDFNLFHNEKNGPDRIVDDFWTVDYDWTLARKIPPDWIAK